MAPPTVSRNWQYYVNQLAPGHASAVLTQNQTLLHTIKEALKGNGSGWTDRAGAAITPVAGATVLGSSNGTTAAMDGVDRWVTPSNLVWNSGVRSWIVLLLTTGQHLLLDCSSSQSDVINAYMSHTPFTGGTTSARPTSATEVQLLTNTFWGGSNALNMSTRLHVMTSADGQAKRVFLCRAGFCVATWLFETPGSPTSGWTNPYFGMMDGVSGNSESLTVNDFCSHTTAVGRGYASSAMTLAAATLGFASGPLFSTTSTVQKLYGVRMASATGGNENDWGLFVDLWLGSTARVTGSTYPATPTPTREFTHFGFNVVAWNGTIPLVAA